MSLSLGRTGDLLAGSDLPRFVRIKTSFGESFPSTVGQKEDGSLRYFWDDTHPHQKHQYFELQLAEDGRGQFSIKSCYTNKYMALERQDSVILAMEADRPNEDRSQWSCTLFMATEYKFWGEDPWTQLWFVHSNSPVCMFLPFGCGKLGIRDQFNHIDPPAPSFGGPYFFIIVDCEREDKEMSIPVSSLPQFVKLEDTSGRVLGQVEKDGSLVVQLERGKTTGKGLCHIKSTFNNKYWALVEGPEPDSVRLAAVATEPNEDKSQRSCTLFRLLRTKTDSTLIHLLFVHSHRFACFSGDSLGVQNGEIPEKEAAIVNVLDAEAVPPPQKHFYDSFRYVVLKSNFNDKYLRQTNKIDSGFANGSVKVDGDDPLSPNCKFELERLPDDLCRIRSCYNNKYLTMERNGIIKAVATYKPKPDDPPERRRI